MENIQDNPLVCGPVGKVLLKFSLPYLLVCFLQQLYGMADLYIAGQFYGADIVTAVSVGSQFMHMVTAVLIGLAMGSTVMISTAVGARNTKQANTAIGNTITLFTAVSILFCVLLLVLKSWILQALSVPPEAVRGCSNYLSICFLGIPIITFYNIITCIYRGTGDSKTPVLFVISACFLNIGLDYLFMGPFGLQAFGAALATVIAQCFSVVFALVWLKLHPLPFSVKPENLKPKKAMISSLLSIGVPIACQDGFIQIAFLIITAIGNMRGLTDAAAIGIVEKLISFFFLVPSALSQSLSAMASQNVGAGKYERAYQSLKAAISAALGYGAFIVLLSNLFGSQILSCFINDADVVKQGTSYLSSYSFDILGCGIHFCMSSYFCAFKKSFISFLQNFLSVAFFRVPLSWLASIMFPTTLFFMGLAITAGSTFQAIFCIVYFVMHKSVFFPSESQALSWQS